MKETILSRQQKWNQRYHNSALKPQPCSLLTDFYHYLPPSGLALDLACGLGGNAIFLSERKFTVSAWDFSQQAISRLEETAKRRRLPITANVIDVFENPPAENCFDVIVVSYFLATSIFDQLKKSLKPNGVLFYQSHNLDSSSHGGPKNTQFLLKDNELIENFNGLSLLETFERPQHCPNNPGQSGIIVKN